MAVAVRYIAMFRTAAVLYLLFGALWIWRYGFTDFHPEQRPFGLGLGVLALLIGVFLFRRARFAIALSALGMGLLCLSSIVFVSQVHGPGILFLAGLAILTGLYAALALRVLFERRDVTPGG